MHKNKSTTITIISTDAEPGAPVTVGAAESTDSAATPPASLDRHPIPRHACVIQSGDDVPVCVELCELDGVPLDGGTDNDR